MNRNKRDSGSTTNNAAISPTRRRKKRKSYSAVVLAWFETLSEAIQDSMHNDSSTIAASSSAVNPSPPQRRKKPRRNAFVLHMDAEPPVVLLEGATNIEDPEDVSPQYQNPDSPPSLVQDMINVSIDSEVEQSELSNS